MYRGDHDGGMHMPPPTALVDLLVRLTALLVF